MKAKVFFSLCCAVALLALSHSVVSAEEIELKLATWGPAAHYNGKVREVWIEEVNKACAGRYKIVDYPGGQLYGPNDMHKALAKGQVDMGLVLQPSMLAMVPIVQGVYLPFAIDSLEAVAKAYSGESREIIEKAMEKKHIKLIYPSYLDGVHLFSNKKNIETVEDFKGLRVLAISPTLAKILVGLGAAPDTSIPQTEQYMALQRKVSDSMLTSTVGGYFQKAHEVAPHITKINVSFPTTLVCMNLEKWNSLPADVQNIMLEAGKKAQATTYQMAIGWEKKFTEELKKEGATVTELTAPERAKIKVVAAKVWEEWAEANGPEAKRLLELNR